ncbi:MAG: Gfo/Idh/MocA family oxidoreductase [Anaerolineae bacterium]|nr:Gfo/Idh/MocA family oxidoreductase [Anaerolineae bacterium]
MTDKIRWGIISTGGIARKFAAAVDLVDDAEVIAVGSRTQQSADVFGDKFDIPRRYSSYQALVADPDVDVIYVATPHNFHKDNTLLALDASKPVLCEKPFAVNVGEAREMVAKAKEKGLFLMEAMWTRFLPAVVRLREMIAAGRLGDIQMLDADFGFKAVYDPKGRLFNPELAGGALLDIGVYPIALASMIFGKPRRIQSSARIGKTGVDEQNAMIFDYEGGKLAVLDTTVTAATPCEAHVIGTNGRATVHGMWHEAPGYTITTPDGASEVFDMGYGGNGFEFQIQEVGKCLREGKTESDIMPLAESLEIMETMDTIRAQWGLTYPMED